MLSRVGVEGRTMGVRIVIVVALCSMPAVAFGACGDRGGPGYRGPNGCVGWSALARVCGNPPTLRCTPEFAQADADQAAEHGEKIRRMMEDAHGRAKGK